MEQQHLEHLGSGEVSDRNPGFAELSRVDFWLSF